MTIEKEYASKGVLSPRLCNWIKLNVGVPLYTGFKIKTVKRSYKSVPWYVVYGTLYIRKDNPFIVSDIPTMGAFLHELFHIWQFQRKDNMTIHYLKGIIGSLFKGSFWVHDIIPMEQEAIIFSRNMIKHMQSTPGILDSLQ